MPLRVNRIAAVGVAAPHLVSEVFVMGSFGPPAGVTKGECLMGTENFLQKNHVGTYGAHGLSKLRQNEFSVKKVKSLIDRKSTRLNSSHVATSYAVFCLKKK